MEDTKVIFELDGNNLIIQCSSQDKMRDICQKYSKKIDKNIDSLLFPYEGSKINFELTFSNQVNTIDRNNGELKILVNKLIRKELCIIKENKELNNHIEI